MPHFNNCSKVFNYDLDAASLRLLNNAFNSDIRYVYGVRMYGSVTSFINRFLGFGLVEHFKFRAMTFIYKLIVTGSSSNLFDLIVVVLFVRG